MKRFSECRLRLPRPRIALVGLIAVLTMIAAPAAQAVLNRAASSFAPPPVPITVRQQQTANGITLSLESAVATAEETRLTFSLTLPQTVASSTESSVLGPIFAGNQLQASGIAVPPAGPTFVMDKRQPGQGVQRFTLVLGAFSNPTVPARITFTQLPLSDGQARTTITGPWSFSIDPHLVGADRPGTTKQLGTKVTHSGVEVSVDRVESGADGFQVFYAVHSDQANLILPVDPKVRIRFADNSSTDPVPMQPVAKAQPEVDPGETVDFVSIFPPLKQSTLNGQLEIGGFVTRTNTVTTLTIRDPFGKWTADPIGVGGERFAVSNVTHTADGTVAIKIDNQEPIDTANAMLLGVHAGSPTASDDHGHRYQADSASTGMRRQSAESLGAGTTTMTFKGVDSSAMELTVTVPGSGLLVRGSWSIDLVFP